MFHVKSGRACKAGKREVLHRGPSTWQRCRRTRPDRDLGGWPLVVCLASIKLQQVPDGKAEALFESVRKLCETMALLRQHELSPALREHVHSAMQGIAEEYGSCLAEHLAAAIPPVGFKRTEAIQQLKELVWGTCNDGLYTCLILDEHSTLLARVRPYLTITEQIELFEAAPDGWRWSAEEVYDVALAYLAEGFMHRKPQHVHKAEQLLVWCAQLYVSGGSSGSKAPAKAVYVERAVCAVLLNRFDKAQKLIKLAGGRVLGQLDGWGVHAVTSLYIMVEKWLVAELFPRFNECSDTNPSMELWIRETNPFPFLQGREASAEPLSVGSRVGVALQGVVLGAVMMGALAAAFWRGRDVENPLPHAFASAATLVQIDPDKFSAQLGFSASFAMAPGPTQLSADPDTDAAYTPAPHTASPLLATTADPVTTNPASDNAEPTAMLLDIKTAENLVQKWQTTKAIAWNHPRPEKLLSHSCAPGFLQQTLSKIEEDHKNVYRSIHPIAAKVLTVQSEGGSGGSTGGSQESWIVIAHIKEEQCEGSETSGVPIVRHKYEYRMQYKLVPQGSKWRITEAQSLGQQKAGGIFGAGMVVDDKSMPYL